MKKTIKFLLCIAAVLTIVAMLVLRFQFGHHISYKTMISIMVLGLSLLIPKSWEMYGHALKLALMIGLFVLYKGYRVSVAFLDDGWFLQIGIRFAIAALAVLAPQIITEILTSAVKWFSDATKDEIKKTF